MLNSAGHHLRFVLSESKAEALWLVGRQYEETGWAEQGDDLHEITKFCTLTPWQSKLSSPLGANVRAHTRYDWE